MVIILTATLVAARPAAAQSDLALGIQSSGTNEVQVFWPATTNINILQEGLGFAPTNSWQDVADAPDVQGMRYSIRRELTNSAAFYRLVNRGWPASSTPPDPATVAPAPQPNVFNDLGSLTAFLYTGSNAVQIGVHPGTIKPVQASVLRGRVMHRDSSPLLGARVAILGHPEYGYTYTRTDGMFDMAVNAAAYTVDYQAVGYCGVQRQVQVTAQSYGRVPEVIMLPQDPVTTQVQFGSQTPLQVANSSSQTDGAGTRSATVFVPAGTTATMVLPDGSSQPVGSLTIRVTEFTVGTNGPKAMPAALPPNSGYTYCADFSSDEAVSQGAKSIQFNQPVPVYVDNFLDVPVGTLVPSGYYDRERGIWVASSNGIVMQVLGATNGTAIIDLHGKGKAETSETLAANGFTVEELQKLALLYPAGKTLWRAPVPHFSIWDFNFQSAPPDPNKPNRPGDKPTGNPNDNSPPDYGTLNFSAQTFVEQIPLVGVPFALHYNSARVPGYRVNDEITIPVAWQRPVEPFRAVAGNTRVKAAGVEIERVVPPHYFDPPSGIRVELDIEGQQSVQTLPGTNQLVTVSWDGRDAYGRLVGGTHLANINIAYEFTEWNYVGGSFSAGLLSQFPALFGNDGNVIAFEGHSGTTLGVGALFQRLLTYPDHRKLGLGGWSPTPLHRMDPAGGILYYGDGRIRKVPEQSLQDDFLNRIYGMSDMTAATPDGSVYFASHIRPYNDQFIFRRNPGGGYQLVTASRQSPGSVMIGWNGLSGVDGLPTDRVVMGATLTSMSAGPDGSLYVTDGRVIARLNPDGIWHVVMGLNAPAASLPILQPDGTPAAESFASYNGGVLLAVGPDSSVYYTASWPSYAPGINGTNYSLVRKIAPDGRIYTVFGGGGVAATNYAPSWQDLFGTAARGAHFASVNPLSGLAVGNDGTVYVSDNFGQYTAGIFQISPGGVILPFLNGMPRCEEGHYDPNPADTNTTKLIQGDQGKRATDVTTLAWGPYELQVGQDGSVYFTDTRFVWRVNPNGIVERVAGRYRNSLSPSADLPLYNGDPLNTDVYPVNAMALTSDGSLFIVRGTGTGIATPPMFIIPGRSSLRGIIAPVSSQIIPSEDGSEVYAFDPAGRHLQTLDSLTGATKWAFGYDANSLVVTMADAAGQVTQIERNGAGQATAIVGPHGQRTSLGMDANGFLGAVTNPAHETTLLTNSSGGSLLSITGPRGATYSVAYDHMGRVTKVTDPLGGGWDDSSSDNGVQRDYSYQIDVNCTNSLGNTLSRKMVLQPNGDTYVYSSLDGHPTESGSTRLNGDRSSYFSDGLSLYTGMGADPRFGNQARQPVRRVMNLPNGLTYNASVMRTAGLTNPADPFSLTGLTNVTTINGNSYTQVYNPTNRTITVVSPMGRTASAVGDAMGRLIHISVPGQPSLDLAYDGLGKVIAVTNSSSASAVHAMFGYDGLGQLVSVTDPLGHSNVFSYDGAGRPIQQVFPDGSVAGFTYDSEYNLTSVTPPGRPSHMFQYNAAGMLTQYTPPRIGTDESVAYRYDSERNLTNITLPDGQQVTFMRGLGGRIELLTLGAGPTLAYEYGSTAGSGFLRPITVSSTTGDRLQFGYVGPVLTSVAWSGSITGQVSIQLNSDMLPASESVNGSKVALGYDNDLLLTQAGDLKITHDPVTGFTTDTTLGGVTDHRQFDDRGLLTRYAASINGTSIWTSVLRFDQIQRITNKVEILGGITNTFGYVYDISGRLAQVWRNGSLAAGYSYDTNGNRISLNSEIAVYDSQDRVLSCNGATFGWSPNGTLTSHTVAGQTTNYECDVRGALTSVTSAAGSRIDYIIDNAGRRIGKKVGGVMQKGWLWNGNRIVAALDGSAVVVQRFIYGTDDQTPSYLMTGTNTYRLLSDERGSVRLVVNIANGAVTQHLDYDEFGRVLEDSNPGFQPFGFAGGLYDPETGLVRFGMRDYSAQVGRWLQRDPINFSGGDLSMFNYANNDPVNQIDPSGCGPNQKLRQLALSGDPRARRAYQNLLNADRNIATGQADDALKSVKAYNNAIRVCNTSIAIVGTFGGIGAFGAGVKAIEAGNTLFGVFLISNAGAATAGNAANVVMNAQASSGEEARSAPTSIPQAVLPAQAAAVVDLALGAASPSPAGPAWINTAAKGSSQVDNYQNSRTALGL